MSCFIYKVNIFGGKKQNFHTIRGVFDCEMTVFRGRERRSEEEGEDGDGSCAEERSQHGCLHHESIVSPIAETKHGAIGGDRHADNDGIDSYDDGRDGDKERDALEEEKDEEWDEGETNGGKSPHTRLGERLPEIDIGHGRADDEERAGNGYGSYESDGLGDKARNTRDAEGYDGDGEV